MKTPSSTLEADFRSPSHEDRFTSGFEAAVKAAKEAAFHDGYRAGFADGWRDDDASASPKTARGIRLRGLPCASCGCSSYTDEALCPCCGSPKSATRSNPVCPTRY